MLLETGRNAGGILHKRSFPISLPFSKNGCYYSTCQNGVANLGEKPAFPTHRHTLRLGTNWKFMDLLALA
jgi:hypothetical protein